MNEDEINKLFEKKNFDGLKMPKLYVIWLKLHAIVQTHRVFVDFFKKESCRWDFHSYDKNLGEHIYDKQNNKDIKEYRVLVYLYLMLHQDLLKLDIPYLNVSLQIYTSDYVGLCFGGQKRIVEDYNFYHIYESLKDAINWIGLELLEKESELQSHYDELKKDWSSEVQK